MIEKRYFIVHGRTSCPFCVRAVETLESQNIAYLFSPLQGDLLSEAKERWVHKTIPIILERDLYDSDHEMLVGGYDDLCAYLDQHFREPTEGDSCDLDSRNN